MKALIWFTTIFIFFLVFLLPALLGLTLDILPANDQPGYNVDHKFSIYGKRQISQEFVSKKENLTAIGISMGNPNLKNDENIVLALFENDTAIRQTTINGKNLEDGDFVKFIFSPIADSKGKKYLFSLMTPEAEQDEVIYTFYSTESPSWVGQMVYTDEESIIIPGVLPFVAYHKPSSKISIIVDIYGSWIKRVLGL